MDYKTGTGAKPEGVDNFQYRDLQIVKQAILKSLIEGGVVKARTPEAEKLVMDWVEFVRRNGKREKEVWDPLPF